MSLSRTTFATKLTHKSVSCWLRRKTESECDVTNKEMRETNLCLLFSNISFVMYSLPKQRNLKYVKQCSLFVTVPKSFLKVQIGNFKILVCKIKFFLKCPFFQCVATKGLYLYFGNRKGKR